MPRRCLVIARAGSRKARSRGCTLSTGSSQWSGTCFARAVCCGKTARADRQALIDRAARMPITRQGQLLGLSRSGVYYRPAEGHRVFRYLLTGVEIERPNQVWEADITYR
jgi:hypothetical protein